MTILRVWSSEVKFQTFFFLKSNSFKKNLARVTHMHTDSHTGLILYAWQLVTAIPELMKEPNSAGTVPSTLPFSIQRC